MSPSLSKCLRVALAVVVAVGFIAAPTFAQTPEQQIELKKAEFGYLKPLVAIGAGLVTLGGAFAIGKLASSAMEGTARQPEAGGAIRTSMIIAAALIEGFTFFALIVCIIAT